ncbi:prolyl oligopeptidase family serine peptidase [Gordonia sp. TBRC 11910]|uniref:Prolyl oligopeptidase family serine peptidase n=1 Tax=Gordonia asplenii TaxID=2725283 RepID=A0A848L3V6_9ACTN|nr:prolyl oligopeptidase family serine peptidase [Gordonia asplenii]NMO03271.1 prolyl oligopeptidase family serine peptidase [Gordonia asplenii]
MSIPTVSRALTPEQLDRRGVASHEVYTAGFYADPDRDFQVRTILGKSTRCGSDVGEVLALIAGIGVDDGEGWFTAWRDLGRRITQIGDAASAAGHRVSAARAYLRAANYLGVAYNSIDGRADTDALLPTFREHRVAWDGFVADTRWPVERVDIPYEGGSMPGWFFRPDASDAPRRTLVVNGGSDGSISGVWCEAGEAALERGYNALLFDGPGQQSMLFERDIPFRADWEKVITPVVDFLTRRGDVDVAKLGLYGVSQGGYWVSRAICFEHRFAGAIADGGVVDVGRTWSAKIPAELMALYNSGDKKQFDEIMSAAMAAPTAGAARGTWAFRSRPYGAQGYSAVLDEVMKFDLTSYAHRISTPLYVIDPDGEQFFTDQPADLAAMAAGATRVRFTQEEGASWHCQPLARELTEQRMFDWLDERMGE